MKNRGIDLKKEKLEQDGTEWKFGAASQPSIAQISETDREQYLPQGEQQFGTEDFQDCATRSPINALETQFNFLYQNNKLKPENKAWLLANGYIVNDRVVFSKRFIAILSGTTRNGNSLKAPLDAIHNVGLIPEPMLMQDSSMNWDAYHDKTKITQAMKDLGLAFKARFPINYEQVAQNHIAMVEKTDGVGVALFAWPDPVNGIYPATDEAICHAVWLFRDSPPHFAFDNYEEAKGDWIKQLAPDYILYDYGYRAYISGENVVTLTDSVKKNLLIQLYTLLAAVAQQFIDYLNAQPKPPIPPHVSKIDAWPLAIQHAEGNKLNHPNTVRFNPWNIKYTNYTASLGAYPGIQASDGGTFARFPSYQLGYDAMRNFLRDACTGKLAAYRPSMPLSQFSQVFARPPNDDYNNKVAAELNVSPNIPISSLL